jgi:chemotaxis protein methyltransferase CheR
MNALTAQDEFGGLTLGAELGAADFQVIAAMLLSEARISLAPQKATLVRSRLARRLRERGLTSYKAYIELVQRDAAERTIMVEALTTNHTHFFREDHHFDHLREEVIPLLRARPAGQPVRIWSSASSSGEEVYSIAMCLLGKDHREAQWAREGDVRLLATDISTEMVEATRKGVYSRQSAEAIPAAYAKLWTRTEGDMITIADEARALVSAMQLNLFDSWPMQRAFDAIFCRNVMIYFDESAKAELETRLIDQLVPGGTLYIGHSERLVGPGRDFMIPCGKTVYRKPEKAGHQ